MMEESLNERSKERREAMLDVASRHFLEHGYAGTTMSAIAATIGGSKATLWNYFPCKELLFAAVIEHRSTLFRAELSPLLDPCGSLDDTLRRFCLRLTRKVTLPDAIALYRLVVAEAGRFPELGDTYNRRALTAMGELLGQYLKQAMDKGQLRREEPISAARHLISLCLSGTHHAMLMGQAEHPTEELIEADVDRALNVFFSGYRVTQEAQ